jgi:hypothetical protein
MGEGLQCDVTPVCSCSSLGMSLRIVHGYSARYPLASLSLSLSFYRSYIYDRGFPNKGFRVGEKKQPDNSMIQKIGMQETTGNKHNSLNSKDSLHQSTWPLFRIPYHNQGSPTTWNVHQMPNDNDMANTNRCNCRNGDHYRLRPHLPLYGMFKLLFYFHSEPDGRQPEISDSSRTKHRSIQ